MVAECLDLRVEDGPVLVGGHRPELQAIGEGSVRNVVQRRAAHEEEPADRLEAVGVQQRPIARLVLLRVRADLDDLAVCLAGSALSGTSQVLPQQRTPDPATSNVGMHVAPQVVHDDAVLDRALDAGRRDGTSIDLGQHDVDGRVDTDRHLELLADVPRQLDLLEPVVQAGRGDDGRHRLVVRVIATGPAEPQAVDRRRVRELQRDVLGRRHRSLPYFWSMWRSTALWTCRQRLASAALARGSSLRSAWASSRSSLR